MNGWQDAQKGQISHPPNPGAPRRAFSQARPQASRTRRRYRPHFVGPFARTMDLGERKNPSSISDLRESQWYVEDFDESRTPLADFFSILLVLAWFSMGLYNRAMMIWRAMIVMGCLMLGWPGSGRAAEPVVLDVRTEPAGG